MNALVLEQVGVRYGTRPALEDVSAKLAAGTVTGIVGPNGAGKTTLLRAALGLQPLCAGAVRVLDRDLHAWPREALARAMAYLPQGGEARWPLKAADVVMLGRLPYRTGFKPHEARDCKAVAEALERCDAASLAPRRMDELSAGERSRVLLARALATGAAVLLADEPAAYLDPAHQLGMMELFREEARRGTAVAVTLHDLPLAARLCDEIVVLCDGRLAAQGMPGEALGDEILARVFQVKALRAEGLPAAFRRI